MNECLPTIPELQKLSMRSVVAYSTRMARRLFPELRGVIADEILNDCLRLSETVATSCALRDVTPASLIWSAQRLTEAYAGAPEGLKSTEKFFILFSFLQTALVASHALEAARDPTKARQEMEGAARATERAFRPLKVLSPEARRAAIIAARQDYDTLIREYGEHDEAVIGEPIRCFSL